jgi:hypothetical protein
VGRYFDTIVSATLRGRAMTAAEREGGYSAARAAYVRACVGPPRCTRSRPSSASSCSSSRSAGAHSPRRSCPIRSSGRCRIRPGLGVTVDERVVRRFLRPVSITVAGEELAAPLQAL